MEKILICFGAAMGLSALAACQPASPPSQGGASQTQWEDFTFTGAPRLAWKDGAAAITFSCSNNASAIIVSAAIALPAPPPPGMKGYVAFSQDRFEGVATRSTTPDHTLALSLEQTPALIAAMKAANTVRITFAGAYIETTADAQSHLMGFADSCTRRAPPPSPRPPADRPQ